MLYSGYSTFYIFFSEKFLRRVNSSPNHLYCSALRRYPPPFFTSSVSAAAVKLEMACNDTLMPSVADGEAF